MVSNDILAYYDLGLEAERLSHEWSLERIRSQSLISRSIPIPPACVIDIGAGPGLYSVWLASLGYSVHVVDLVPKHIEQARDAALLMGPLYHLTSEKDRLKALSEALRVLRPAGILIAVGISRFAALLEGFFSGSINDPAFCSVVDRGLADGQHINTTGKPEHFTTAYFHRPGELEAEVSAAGFRVKRVAAIEGFGPYLPDLKQRWQDQTYRTYLLDVLERTETEPSMLGTSPHVMVVATRSASIRPRGRPRHD